MKNPQLKIEVWHEGDKAKRGRADDAEPEPLEDDSMVMGDGEIIAMAVKV